MPRGDASSPKTTLNHEMTIGKYAALIRWIYLWSTPSLEPRAAAGRDWKVHGCFKKSVQTGGLDPTDTRPHLGPNCQNDRNVYWSTSYLSTAIADLVEHIWLITGKWEHRYLPRMGNWALPSSHADRVLSSAEKSSLQRRSDLLHPWPTPSIQPRGSVGRDWPVVDDAKNIIRGDWTVPFLHFYIDHHSYSFFLYYWRDQYPSITGTLLTFF